MGGGGCEIVHYLGIDGQVEWTSNMGCFKREIYHVMAVSESGEDNMTCDVGWAGGVGGVVVRASDKKEFSVKSNSYGSLEVMISGVKIFWANWDIKEWRQRMVQWGGDERAGTLGMGGGSCLCVLSTTWVGFMIRGVLLSEREVVGDYAHSGDVCIRAVLEVASTGICREDFNEVAVLGVIGGEKSDVGTGRLWRGDDNTTVGLRDYAEVRSGVEDDNGVKCLKSCVGRDRYRDSMEGDKAHVFRLSVIHWKGERSGAEVGQSVLR
ncbi:hypothetical protein Tco_0784954 [Tanacetum coccineum]